MVYKIAQERILHESERFYIREAKPAELDVLHAIFEENLGDIGRGGNKLTLVALEKGTNNVIGGIERGIDISSGTAWGLGLFVLPQFRKLEIGRTLVRVIDEELEKRGVREVMTVPQDDDVHKFFENCGYKDATLEVGEFNKMDVMKKELWKKPKQS